MARPTHRGRAWLVGLTALLVGVVGYTRSGPTIPAVDPSLARQTLRATLDAWQAGEPYGALAKLSPPVRVIDEDWLAGLKLTAYEVGPQDHVLGSMLQSQVTLRLRDRAGKAIRKTVSFNVTTGRSPSVIRQD